MLAAADCAQTTRCACTSSRTPVMPTGLRMPSCESSSTYSRGIACRIFWSAGMATAFAASSTRSRSRPRHFAVADRHDARRVAALHVVAGNRRVDRADLAAGHQLGFLDRALDRLHRRLDVHHHAALEAARLVRADADHFDRIARRILADQRHDLRGADVEADDQGLVAFAIHVFPCDCGAVGGVGVVDGQLSAKPLV